jgi:hypothetical protein
MTAFISNRVHGVTWRGASPVESRPCEYRGGGNEGTNIWVSFFTRPPLALSAAAIFKDASKPAAHPAPPYRCSPQYHQQNRLQPNRNPCLLREEVDDRRDSLRSAGAILVGAVTTHALATRSVFKGRVHRGMWPHVCACIRGASRAPTVPLGRHRCSRQNRGGR